MDEKIYNTMLNKEIRDDEMERIWTEVATG
jgi:hypothetical protein